MGIRFFSRGGGTSGRGESTLLASTGLCWRRMASVTATLKARYRARYFDVSGMDICVGAVSRRERICGQLAISDLTHPPASLHSLQPAADSYRCANIKAAADAQVLETAGELGRLNAQVPIDAAQAVVTAAKIFVGAYNRPHFSST